MCSDSTSMFSRMERIVFASCNFPFCTSHRGDSGKRKAEEQMSAQKISGKARGNLQQTELFWWNDNPKLTQLARAMPLAIKMPMTTTFLPRCFGLEHSACQTGTTALTPPTPIPDMMRPTTNWARVNEED